MATRATATASPRVSLHRHRTGVPADVPPDDYCLSCREWITFPNAVFVRGPDDTVDLMCERCVAESDGDRLRRFD